MHASYGLSHWREGCIEAAGAGRVPTFILNVGYTDVTSSQNDADLSGVEEFREQSTFTGDRATLK